MELHHQYRLWIFLRMTYIYLSHDDNESLKISKTGNFSILFEMHLNRNTVPFFSPALPQNPLLHVQWNISASLTWHAAPFLQGFGWQGLLPHSPTPLPYKLSPLFSCRLSTRLLTSSMRIQPTRPVATDVCSLALKKRERKNYCKQSIICSLKHGWLMPGEN